MQAPYPLSKNQKIKKGGFSSKPGKGPGGGTQQVYLFKESPEENEK